MSDTRKPLIICYSRQGHSHRAAQALLRGCDADLATVETDRYRFPLLWIFRAIMDVAKERRPSLRGVSWDDVSRRPWVIVCGPVWANQPAPPLRTVLSRLRGMDMPVGVLLTLGGTTSEADLEGRLRAMLNGPPKTVCFLRNKHEGTAEMTRRLDHLVEAMRGSTTDEAA